MARALRVEFPGAFYHVTSRGNERKPIYGNDTDRLRYLSLVADIVNRFDLLLHAYVLMDNHYHLLIETLEANLARAMRALNGGYAKQFNRHHQRVGHLFQGRYTAILVERESYLVELSRYIHLNPVRAGIVGRAEDYRWSSAPAYVGLQAAPPFLTLADLLGHFGRSVRHAQPAYRAFLQQDEGRPASQSPLDAVVAGTLLGQPDWVEAMRERIVAQLTAPGVALDVEEMPAVSKLRLRPTLDDVIDAVSVATKVARGVITGRHSREHARALAMYLAHDRSGLTHREIGAVFGVGRFAVSKAARMIGRQLERDHTLATMLSRLRAMLRCDGL